MKGLGLDSKRTWAKTRGSLSMEKLTLGLEIKFQAHVAMWLLFYKNAQERVSDAARPGSSASCPASAEGHRQESTGPLAPKRLAHWADRVHARPTPPLLESLWSRSSFNYYPLLLLESPGASRSNVLRYNK